MTTLRNRRELAFAVACALPFALAPAVASGSVINVTTTADEAANNTTCSLREAVTAANENSNSHEDACTAGTPGGNVDFVELPAGIYTLLGSAGDDANASGDLDITTGGAVVLDGIVDTDGVPQTVVDGNNNDRLIDVQPDAVGTTVVNVQNVVLRDGNVAGPSEDGGGIRIGDDDSQFFLSTSNLLNNHAGRFGGAVSFANGSANGPDFGVSQTEFAGNTAGEDGGAIYFSAPDSFPGEVETSSFVGNGSGAAGGAVYLDGSTFDTRMSLENSTMSGNTAAGGGGGLALGAGGAAAELHFTTVANNSTETGLGGGVRAEGTQTVLLHATILAGNTAGGVTSNCGGNGTFSDDGYNLEAANTCALNTGSPDNSLINTDPLLAPLALNPAPDAVLTTRTHGLFDTSPAIDLVPRTPVDFCDDLFTSNGVDQRYVARPATPGFCDAGAFEGSVGPVPIANPPPMGTPPTPTPPTATKKKCKRKKKRAAAAKKKHRCKKKRGK